MDVALEVNETTGVLEDLKISVDFDFSEILSDSLIWNYLSDGQLKSVALAGDMVELRAADVQASEINEYFESKGFQQDEYNLASSDYIGQVGFQKDDIVCTMVSGVSQSEPENESNELLSDITVRCAKFNI